MYCVILTCILLPIVGISNVCTEGKRDLINILFCVWFIIRALLSFSIIFKTNATLLKTRNIIFILEVIYGTALSCSLISHNVYDKISILPALTLIAFNAIDLISLMYMSLKKLFAVLEPEELPFLRTETNLPVYSERTYQVGQLFEPGKCVICLCDFKEGDILFVIQACSHYYHKVCVRQWLTQARTCPICRTGI